MRKLIYVVLGILLAGSFAFTAVKAATQTKRNQKLQDIQIQSKDVEATKLEVDLKRLNIELKKTLEDKIINESKVKDLEQQIKDAQEREQKLQADLQAKIKAKADAQAKVAQAASTFVGTSKVYAATGSCADWVASAGIADVNSAVILIQKESGCNPNAVNSSSGACGVAQELPCGKSGCSLGDGACQVAWMNVYIQGRYGSWANALAFHRQNNWY